MLVRSIAFCLAVAGVIAPRLLAAQAASRAPSIAFVPLDDRPVTYELPRMLGAIAGQPVVTPPRAALGHYLQPGDPGAIARWLRSDATDGVAALVASTDMVAYGGLVASRLPGVSDIDADVRLQTLAELKRDRSIPFVAAFATIMRLAPTGVGDTVDAITAYANLPDPPQSPDDIERAERLHAALGPPLQAYLATRARNLAVDRWLLQLGAEGGFDRIILGQDDAGPQGLHLRDIAVLHRTMTAFDLANVASLEPGADELGMVLLARAFARQEHWTPTVRVAYSRVAGADVNDHLEFVPIGTTIADIIAACGGRQVGGDADIELFVRVAGTADADERAFEDTLAAEVARARSVAVADLTFLDGNPGPAQREFTQALIARGIASKIDAFASWNTAANTIGTALPEAIAVGAGRRSGRYDARAHAQFMLDRYADDYAFHQFVRPELDAVLRARGFDTTLLAPGIVPAANAQNRALLWPRVLALLACIYPQYRDAGLTITLPWDRTFETELDVRLAPRPRAHFAPGPRRAGAG